MEIVYLEARQTDIYICMYARELVESRTERQGENMLDICPTLGKANQSTRSDI